jgi:hypothetical protein
MLQSLAVDDLFMDVPPWLQRFEYGPEEPWPIDSELPLKLEHFTISFYNLLALSLAEFFAHYRKGLKSLTIRVLHNGLLNGAGWCSELGQTLPMVLGFGLDTLNLELAPNKPWYPLLPRPADDPWCIHGTGYADD